MATSLKSPPIYVRHYTAKHHKEEATTKLAWRNGVLVQMWRISETRDIYCNKAKTSYSHTEDYREEVWREIPTIP
jgi:hypothetical protein